MSSKSFLLAISCCLAVAVFSQGKKENTHTIAIELQADEDFEAYRFKKALQGYQTLENQESTISSELKFKMGVCCLETYEYQEALQYMQSSVKDSARLPTSYAYYLAKAYQLNGYVDQAIIAYRSYLRHIKGNQDLEKFTEEILREIEKCKTAQFFYQNAKDVEVKLLSPKVNSVYDDYDPLLASDHSTLYFTSDRPHAEGGAVHELDGSAYEDIYRVVATDSGWSTASKVQEFDAKYDNACVALSHKGDKMIIYRTASGTLLKPTTGHLYFSEKKEERWSKPEKLPFSESKQSNEISACFSVDDKTIYFSSDRKGGFGGKDLYKSTLENDDWSTPVNLGETINTPYDEDAPFVHPDGDRLYFSSQGHQNMGGFDVFVTSLRKGSDTVENLGYPINTTADDISFVIGADGKTGYIADNRAEGLGEMDIYRLQYFDTADHVVVVRAQLLAGDKPVDAIVKVFTEQGGRLHSVYHTNPINGQVVMLLYREGRYKITVNDKEYAFFEEWVMISDNKKYQELNLAFYLERQ